MTDRLKYLYDIQVLKNLEEKDKKNPLTKSKSINKIQII